MEERIIDDEFGKGVRLKKTKDGYVLADEAEETEGVEEGEEVAFEFPTFEVEEGEEDLVGLSPEEVEKYRRQRAEEAAKRRAEYEQACAEGEALLKSEDFAGAENVFEKALQLDDEPTEASVGYWKAKTANFTNPDALIKEYEDIGVESMEFDLGYKAAEILKAEFKQVFETKYAALVAEETPLKETVEGKQGKRRSYLKERLKKATIKFGATIVPLLLFAFLTVFFAFKNQTVPDLRYLAPIILSGIGTVASFILFIVSGITFLRALRLYGKNERLESTDDGARLVEIGLHKEIYEYFLAPSVPAEEESENQEEEG